MLERGEALGHLRFGGLRAVAAEGATRGVAIGRVVRDVRREILARRRIDLHAVPARRVRGALRGEADVEETRAGGCRAGLENLRDDIADETMVLMTVATLGAPGEDDIGMQLVERRSDALREFVERLARPRAEHRQ